MPAILGDLPADHVECFSSCRADLGPREASEPIDLRVIGVGGGGCNAVHRIVEEGPAFGEFWALNTDAQHLLTVKAHHKVLLGRNLCRGRSANSDPRIGELAAEEARPELGERLKGARLVFLLAALGGGTGSGATPVVAKLAREARALSVALVTHPFSVEGATRLENARASLERLRATADFVSVFPNDRLLAEHPGLSLRDALRHADHQLFRPVRALHGVARRDDFPALRRRLKGSVNSAAASAQATRQRGYAHAMERALEMLGEPRGEAPNSAVVAVGTGGDLSQHEAAAIVGLALDALGPGGSVLWGYYRDDRLHGLCEVSVFLSRTASP